MGVDEVWLDAGKVVTGATGDTGADGADVGPGPTALTAATVNEYVAPFTKPVTVSDVAAELNDTGARPEGVTTYPVTGEPPVTDGAVHDTVTCPSPATTPTPDGGPGGPAGITETDGADAGPVPTAFTAATMNVYAVPFVNPVTVPDVAGELNVTAGRPEGVTT